MLETAVQLERDPPETATSAYTKPVDASERVKVSVAVSPALRRLSASALRAWTSSVVLRSVASLLR